MNKEEAAQILETHNEWRRGAEIPPTDPTALGEALDVAVSELRKDDEREPRNLDTIIEGFKNSAGEFLRFYTSLNQREKTLYEDWIEGLRDKG